MKIPRKISVLLTVCTAAAFCLAGPVSAAPAEAPVSRYVALGDSYASGLGAGAYALDTIGTCYRSARSYSEVMAAGWRSQDLTFGFVNATCSGATTQSVRDSQLGSVTPDTDLVTIQIGANDINAMGYGQTCLLADCSGAPTEAMLEQMPALSSTVRALLGDIARQAPSAQIVLTGYGNVLTTNPTSSSGDPVCMQASPDEREAVGYVMAGLDASLLGATLAARYEGINAVYASPYAWPGTLRDSFEGHSLCEGGQAESWYHGLAIGDEPIGLLHPKVPWHPVMVRVILSKLEGS